METSTKKRMISDTASEGIDRISSLPDEVIHNILSFLCIFDEVVQLSVLSKRWRYIWTTMPYLRFDIDNSCLLRLNCKWSNADFFVTSKEKFKDFINWVLISQRETKLAKFLLCVGPYSFFDKMEILRWIHAATRRNVQQLVLQCRLCEPFVLPFCLATSESLQVLKLNLSWTILKLPGYLGFCQLKLLHLENVKLSGEDFPSCFFSKCHHLKSLILHGCGFEAMTQLSIASTSLIHVTIVADKYNQYANCELKISCPNLKFLKYEAPMPKDMIIENLLSIEDVSIYFLTNTLADTGISAHKMIKEVSSTSALTLCNASILGMYKSTSKERLSPISFCKLKTLMLYVGVDEDSMQAMILLLKYSPNLEVLQLCSCENHRWFKNWQMHDLDESIVCLESHLKSIHLTNFKGEENEIKLLKFFLKNARVLEKLTIFWEEYPDKSDKALKEVLKFPRTSSQVVLTFLDAKPQPRSCKWYDRYSK